MNNIELFELFKNDITASNTSDSYIRLCDFVSAMRCGKYLPISDEDIRRGVECEKAHEKNKAKILFMGFQDQIQKSIEAAIELKYSQCLQKLLNYKYTYQNQNNLVI